jgi:hypothetical protein
VDSHVSIAFLMYDGQINSILWNFYTAYNDEFCIHLAMINSCT